MPCETLVVLLVVRMKKNVFDMFLGDFMQYIIYTNL